MKIVITGITGSLSRAFCSTYKEYQKKHKLQEIKISGISRDEYKQSVMSKEFPDVDFYLGDVRDQERLDLITRGASIVVHTAALKRIEKGELDPIEFNKTNILGTENVIKACIANKVPKAVFLSTDKACEPVNHYGFTKAVAESTWMAANSYNDNGIPCFSAVRYGNVMGSRGSVIPLFMQQKNQGKITVTDIRMTRFMITLEQAVSLVWDAILDPKPKLHIPKLPSMGILQIAEAVAPGCEIDVIGIRPGEKLHEKLKPDYSSEDNDQWMTVETLRAWILEESQSQTPLFSFNS